ncbi:MAG: FAD-binding protein [Spirochaetales bacterium]|nr:FAD-binding protein [Spirochaetales bacterium]
MSSMAYEVERIKTGTCIVGTGAAGYNAACRLKRLGKDDILLISENKLGGTSRNTGSDKQTYYKLTLSGDGADSVYEMAQTLFEGKAVDGDIALCEAALSSRCFLRLAELGLPFPTNRFGEYVGYKTDHDPRTRATSIGPYTSREMTRALEKEAEQLGVPFRNHLQVIKLISDGKRCYGLICLDTNKTDRPHYVVIDSDSVVYATGGPAGMYADSVYPQSQHGSSGIAFEAGVKGRNLTEWQFGLASVNPRWNVSGTYMQALPRFVSTDKDGKDEREFLMDFFKTPEEMLSNVFLKGYQWPFDVRKVEGGSSIIDILVYLESCKGRHVFLDFIHDPVDGRFSFDGLKPEAYQYISKANALIKTPIERLRVMNQPAVDFYRDKGVDLEKEYLEIALCAQHNNGGLDLDMWWQSNVKGLFVAGEVAGSHGVYRPGGSALNAGQVGSTRCAQFIAGRMAKRAPRPIDFEEFSALALKDIVSICSETRSDSSNVEDLISYFGSGMSKNCAAVRDPDAMRKFLSEVNAMIGDFCNKVSYKEPRELKLVYRLRDMLISQKCYIESMIDYLQSGGKSRGSALYHDNEGRRPYKELPEAFTFSLDDGSKDSLIQEMSYKEGECTFSWRPVRPIPQDDDFFENVWREFRKDGNIR